MKLTTLISKKGVNTFYYIKNIKINLPKQNQFIEVINLLQKIKPIKYKNFITEKVIKITSQKIKKNKNISNKQEKHNLIDETIYDYNKKH